MALAKVNVIPIRDTEGNTGYRWRDRDPILDLVNGLIKDSKMSFEQISNRCGVSKSTLWNWDRGKTKRPQAVTIKFVLNAIGYELTVRRNMDKLSTAVPLTQRLHIRRSWR